MRRLVTMGVTAGLLVGLALPAAADHTHVRMTGNGDCVILAANGYEDEVVLPHAEPPEFPAKRQHPLHVNVHKGPAGDRLVEDDTGERVTVPVMWVLNVDDFLCQSRGYVNEQTLND